MKNLKLIFSLAALAVLNLFIIGCNQDPAPSLYEVESKGNTPVISGTVPSGEALAGVTDITINGSNFSPVKDDNMVYFGTAKATVLQASATSLVVKAPTLIQNDLDLKVAVMGVENFSNKVKISLKEAVGVYYAFAKGIDDPMTVTVDKNENVYVYLNNKGIKKITPAGAISDFAPKGAESFFFDMKFGPNNILYGTRNLRAIFQVEAGKATATYVTFPTGITIIALDFDTDKNMWAAGGGGNMYSVTPSKVSTAFPIDFTVSALRVHNGYLYVAAKNTTEEAIFRYKINSNTSLGAKEKYFDIGAKFGLGKVAVNAMTFASDGELILATDQTNAFIGINSSGSSSDVYPGLISPNARSLFWGNQRNLFYVREYSETSSSGTVTLVHTLVRVDMQKTGAPYNGM